MAPGPIPEYRLPPLPEFLSSWNPFDLGDGLNARYEQAPLTDQSDPSVGLGLGISRDGRPPAHTRCQSDDTLLATLTPSDRASSRFATSESPLTGESPTLVKCPTKKTIVQRRLSWIPLTILVLALYSTVLSGLYLVVACLKPQYGQVIGINGKLAPSTANLLSTLFAKTIELAYVTVCVAFLGQVLTRRALTKGSRGISIADMSMRSWIMQPGSLIVHWESLRYSGWTILGALALTVTIVAMLYTTAAEALVTPKLKMSAAKDRVLVGDVYTSFANTQFLTTTCETPVAITADENRNLTCLDMKHAGQSYHNYQAFLHDWSLAPQGTLGSRPLPKASLYDNTTVTGSWIDRANMTELSERYGRIVHNITAAMPHSGVIAAANHRANAITQPQDTSGEGTYELDASLPAPAVNILCAEMNATELAPLVYTLWPHTKGQFNPVTWTTNVPDNVPNIEHWRNRTVVDDIFGFGPDYPGQYSPVFGKLPEPHNTILNVTAPYSTDSIYFLGASPPNINPPYFLCSLKAKQSPKCLTRYRVAEAGAQLSTVCEENHPLQYNLRNPDSLDGIWALDWKYIASEWGFTLSLNSGITDGLSANAHLLMQFVPKTPSLDPHLPSLAEALAVLAGNTLLLSTESTPFVPFWNYTAENNILPQPATQCFNATLRTVEYTSGGTERWQGVFYPILTFAFITSTLCLAFMLLEVRGRQITDFTEPQNLFALAMNSPSTAKLRGACGAGPDVTQLGERWYVAMEEEEEHYYIRTKAEEHTPRFSMATTVSEGDVEGTRKTVEASPAIREYTKLASRKSWLSGFY